MTKIKDLTELQFRQVNPSWMEDDGPSRLAFIPTKKDGGLLSLDRSASTDAKSSFEDFEALGLRTAGTFGLTPSEFEEEPNPVSCYESPLAHNPHHSHADFNGLSNGEKKKKSQELRRKALSRGKIHP
ncbi:hypothetical protein [Aliiroseovarius lamellibrachiae]|uniref:hypothetical protein n=1 Tax=Aliiroseovarius lamellibrachiae TaxID=1924933 RepID=UPI001BE07CB0|nr:hypothetical protein [Aliiroseovarius lamellibrachiae]MBT2130635.1 hypothetical protein [Aliiroseovarius lamellibrachiae]